MLKKGKVCRLITEKEKDTVLIKDFNTFIIFYIGEENIFLVIIYKLLVQKKI